APSASMSAAPAISSLVMCRSPEMVRLSLTPANAGGFLDERQRRHAYGPEADQPLFRASAGGAARRHPGAHRCGAGKVRLRAERLPRARPPAGGVPGVLR